MKRFLLRWVIPGLIFGTLVVGLSYLLDLGSVAGWRLGLFVFGVLLADAITDDIRDLMS